MEIFYDDLFPEIDVENIDTKGASDDTDETELEEQEDSSQEGSEETEETPTYENGDPEAIAAFTVFQKLNLFSKEDEKTFDGSWDTLDMMKEELPSKLLKEAVVTAKPEFRDLLLLVYNEPDLTKDKLKEYVNAHIQDSEEDSDSEIKTNDDAREYLEKVYKARGLSQKQITNLLNIAEEDEELLSEAKKIQADEEQKNKGQRTKALLEKQQKEAAELQSFQANFVSTLEKEKYSPRVKSQMIHTLKNIKSISKEVFTSPQALVQFAEFMMHFDPNKKAFDYEKYAKRFESKVNEKLEKNLTRDAFKKAQSGHGSNSTSKFTEADLVFELD